MAGNPPFPNSRLRPRGRLDSTIKFYAENPNANSDEVFAYYASLGLPPYIDEVFWTHHQAIRLPSFDTIATLIIELANVAPTNETRVDAIRSDIYKLLSQNADIQASAWNVMATPWPITYWIEKDVEHSRALLATLEGEEAAQLQRLITEREQMFHLV